MKLQLSKEAKLLDSPLFIVKMFLSILTAYALLINHPIVGKDMISVLFGVVLTLEPVALKGIKSGISQIKATVIGVVVAGLIISVGGINIVTVPLAVAVTLYVTLLMDWKTTSIIALFTAIYMTQYIQLDAFGEPSVLLTARLRLLALSSGVFIGVFYNWLFSKVFYKKIIKNRLLYISYELKKNFEKYLLRPVKEDGSFEEDIVSLFNDIDITYDYLNDLLTQQYSNTLQSYLFVLKKYRLINHFFMDLYIVDTQKKYKEISIFITNISSVIEKIETGDSKAFVSSIKSENSNINKIHSELSQILEELR